MTKEELRTKVTALATAGDESATATLAVLSANRELETHLANAKYVLTKIAQSVSLSEQLLKAAGPVSPEVQKIADLANATQTVTTIHMAEVAKHDREAKEFFGTIVAELTVIANAARAKSNRLEIPSPAAKMSAMPLLEHFRDLSRRPSTTPESPPQVAAAATHPEDHVEEMLAQLRAKKEETDTSKPAGNYDKTSKMGSPSAPAGPPDQ